jgi:hypothetical protein
MKKTFFIIFGLGLCYWFFGTPALASVNYTRTPAGDRINNPINVSVSVDAFTDFETEWGFFENTQSWLVNFNGYGEGVGFSSPCFSPATLSYSLTNFVAPLGDYWGFMATSFSDTECQTQTGNYLLESGLGMEAFLTITDETIHEKIITLDTGSSSDILASVGTLTTDLWAILAVMAGTPLAFFVIRGIIGLF